MKKYFSFFLLVLFLFITKCNAYTKAPVDITKMDINDLSIALDNGYITSETLVKLYLERIDEYNETFNAINQLNEHALEQARELDKERQEGKVRSKLHGIPILVKCNIDVYGMPTTAGSKTLLDNFPNQNAFVIQKLIDEGAIILGSTNMSEFAFSARDSLSSYGYVRNVFNFLYTSYGSSGGSAVAVKATFAAASLGTDTNSSVRLPAAGAGLVGIRPTYGLVSRTGVIPYDVTRDTVGVITKDVSDNALILSIIAGTDEKDKVTLNAKKDNYSLDDTSLEGINIGVPTQYLKGSGSGESVTSKTDDDIYELAIKAIDKLEKAGANIIYLDSFVKSSNLTIAAQTKAGSTMCDGFNNYIEGTSSAIRSFSELVRSSGHIQNLSGYLSSCGDGLTLTSKEQEMVNTYREYVDDYFKEYDLDVILYPTLKNKPFKYNVSVANISPGSSLGSAIGYPSITVPMGYDKDGFSYGLEFLSQAYNEKMLYNVSIEFEKMNGNVLDTSPLTPALYEVPSNVTQLLNFYSKVLTVNSHDKNVTKWVNGVKEFLDNYNSYEDVSVKAKELLDRYETDKIDDIFKDKFLGLFTAYQMKRFLVYTFFVVITLVMIIIFFREFFEKG